MGKVLKWCIRLKCVRWDSCNENSGKGVMEDLRQAGWGELAVGCPQSPTVPRDGYGLAAVTLG